MPAAKKLAAGFGAVADDFAAAVLALRRERMNGALKAVKVMGDAVHDHLDRFVILVSTNLTTPHNPPSLLEPTETSSAVSPQAERPLTCLCADSPWCLRPFGHARLPPPPGPQVFQRPSVHRARARRPFAVRCCHG